MRQFLNAQRVGPIGMSEEKDADELAAEAGPGAAAAAADPDAARAVQRHRRAAASASPGEWCRENGVTPPPGSFEENMTMTTGV